MIMAAAAVAGDHEVKVVNNTNVINNLIMPVNLKPLKIDRPPMAVAPLKTRPFNFNQNMGPLPQIGDSYKSPFSEYAAINQPSPFISNNVVIRKSKITNHWAK
jgi:hypothetical protein